MKCKLYTATHVITLEKPGDFWETHAKLLEAMGIKDVGPVVDEAHAEKIAAIAARRYRDSVVQAVGNSTHTGKTFESKRTGKRRQTV